MKQIDYHYKILERIETNKKDIFLTMYEALKGHYGFEKDHPIDEVERIQNAYNTLYKRYGYLLGHYFRNLYRVWKNINDIEVNGFDKRHYAKLMRAQLSEYEVILLFYNCLWVNDENNFKNLVQDYELLEGINYDKLLEREHHIIYSDEAFGKELV